MSSAEASGERGIAIGRDAIHSIFVTGDLKQFFGGDYRGLAEAYRSPWPVFDRVEVDRFVGRAWLETLLDSFLQKNDRGLFVVEAEAGLGKTAFLAHLVRERGYIHYFFDRTSGRADAPTALRSLSAQHIRAWKLSPDAAEGVPPGSAAWPEFFQNLLKKAADRRDQIKPEEKIIIVVDALDVADTPRPGQNVLGLPRIVPEGVYLVVSQRPVEVPLTVEAPREVVRIEAQGRDNLADMGKFLKQAAGWPGVKKALDASRIPLARFIATLLDKSQGVWIYLHYVLAEIKTGRRTPLTLEDLPQGLWQYYAGFWNQWRRDHEDVWDALHLPLLSTLAAAQEGLTSEMLSTLGSVVSDPIALKRLRRVLDTEWSPYLAATAAGSGSARAYRFYHASLREFFGGAIDTAHLTWPEQTFVEELAEATRQAHARIADVFVHRWGGWDAGLPALQTIAPARLDTLDRYGLHHLAAHLEAAGRENDLHRLMRLEWSGHQGEQTRARFENTWYTMHERVGDTLGYLNDVDRAWQLAERAYAGRQSSSAIGLQCRYALIVTSLCSLAGNIPPALLAALVEKGIWPGPQGLAYARRMQGPELRTRALAALAPHLGSTERDQALREALEAALAIRDEQYLFRALAALAPHLTAPLLGEALAAALAIWGKPSRSRALAPHLTPPLLGEVLAAAIRDAEVNRSEPALANRDERYLSRALAALAPHLTAPLLGEALAATRAIGDEKSRSRALAALAPHLTAPLLGEALAAAETIGETDYPHLAKSSLAALALRLAERPSATLYPLWSRTIRLSATRTRAGLLGDLCDLIPVLAALGGAEATAETFRAIQDVGRWWP